MTNAPFESVIAALLPIATVTPGAGNPLGDVTTPRTVGSKESGPASAPLTPPSPPPAPIEASAPESSPVVPPFPLVLPPDPLVAPPDPLVCPLAPPGPLPVDRLAPPDPLFPAVVGHVRVASHES